jgi:hypothetical protein
MNVLKTLSAFALKNSTDPKKPRTARNGSIFKSLIEPQKAHKAQKTFRCI